MALAGQKISALDFTEAKTANSNTANDNVSSTTFVAGSPAVDTTFIAPTSGKVEITVGGLIQDDTGNNRGFLEFEVYQGTSAAGTPIIVAPNTQYRWTSKGRAAADPEAASRSRTVTGLTAGVEYYARTVHAVDAGSTVDFKGRSIDVKPLAA